MNTLGKIGIAFLAGAVAGAVAGILMAPAKGSDTRKNMANKAREFGDAVKEKARNGWRQASNMKDEVMKEAGELLG